MKTLLNPVCMMRSQEHSTDAAIFCLASMPTARRAFFFHVLHAAVQRDFITLLPLNVLLNLLFSKLDHLCSLPVPPPSPPELLQNYYIVHITSHYSSLNACIVAFMKVSAGKACTQQGSLHK